VAVTRFTLPASDLRVMARLIGPHEERAAAELMRAAARPGLTAELTEREFRVLFDLAPWPTNIAIELDKAQLMLDGAVARERERLRGPALFFKAGSKPPKEAK
jgi:hypothetical protein